MSLSTSAQQCIPGTSTFAALLAAQPASGVPTGTMAVTTDYGLVYSNGQSWIPVGRTSILAQSAIPFIIPPSGSISAAGALSGITLNKTYASCYMWFPANAVAASIAAGWYYVAMSSATAGTVYLNTYTSGTPVIPASLTPVTAGQTAYTTLTTPAVNAIAATVPANSMGINGELDVDYIIATTSNTDTKTATVVFGSTTVQTSAIATTAAADTGVALSIRNAGATGVQFNISTPTGDPAQAASTALTQSAVDTTVNETIAIALQLGTATDYIVLASYSIRLLPN
jgi:hypothetical protein